MKIGRNLGHVACERTGRNTSSDVSGGIFLQPSITIKIAPRHKRPKKAFLFRGN